MDEQSRSGGVGEIVEALPEPPAELYAINGSDNNDKEQIKRRGADGIFDRLLRRPEWQRDVQKTERGLL